MIVPVDVVPSPQLIVAVKLFAFALALASVKAATTPEKDWPETAWMFCAVTARFGGAGATVARLSPDA